MDFDRDDRLQGFVQSGYETVAEAFRANFQQRGDHGAAFAAVVDGKPVIDIWAGSADRGDRRAWDADTIAGIFSGTKGLVATCLLLLLERGQLDLDLPVCTYWPEFAAHGKDWILVRHLVSHQAGLPGLTTPVTAEEATDDVRMAQLLADQVPICKPGTKLQYHALTFGWLCGELVRRIDGRSIGRLFADDVARPLSLDAWIGLPLDQESRVAVLERGPGFGIDTQASSASDRVAWSIWENPRRFSVDPMPANTRSWRAAEIPAGNGVASVRAVAKLYGCLARGGDIDGTRILQAITIEKGRQRLIIGVEPYLGQQLAYGVGFQLQTKSPIFGEPEIAFGHDGAGGSMHGAWPELKTGFSYVTNTLMRSEAGDPRSNALLAALHRSVCARA
ncbi:esterase (plasmid) [Agrobacterium vitis]|uniref:serine hydrolase domain-containing protein n=1 Tax=Agrobacterium vitis TaxID=373 RepID=UPI001571CA29|nr:serine hydrolase domain-containing protein [Agrobacterium vitis]NSZ55403.1 beta-lactamase family protein [Agrobacterium vitis]NTA34615.1 beta-lactamase family protein [Agrobacterium vitis]BCH67869.1 esterase [Agrobacterium vitis]